MAMITTFTTMKFAARLPGCLRNSAQHVIKRSNDLVSDLRVRLTPTKEYQ
jgi:hypothetical protein